MKRALFLLLFLAACAKRESAPPLPGDSVGVDGSVTLSPKNFSTTPALGPIEAKLFAPEVVMEHQAAIGITPAQKDAILKEVQHGQDDMLKMQWDLNADKIDEAKAEAQAQKVMDDENRIKSSHLGMLIRVKNQLGPEQQKKLRELRDGQAAAPDASASSP